MGESAQIAILGSGFGGSLAALLLERSGFETVLIDRGSHPRFAIGESSTPVADYVLGDLARTYDLPRIAPLTKYGSWQRAYPQLTCGLKRGFSYFCHRPNEPFIPSPEHANELLVAASTDDEHSDTHWLRSDVDSFFCRQACDGGVRLLDRTQVTLECQDGGWRIAADRDGTSIQLRAEFLIDATGEGGAVASFQGMAGREDTLHTRSRGLFGHFTDVMPWHDVLVRRGGVLADHPFYCDHAALHQVLDVGWMWQLRFNNGVTSAGFALDCDHCPLDPGIEAEREWKQLMRRYPSIGEQFAGARLVQPAAGLRRTGRIQRLAATMVGDNWAMLPHTAGFIDPLHSTGIAHTLTGIERLVPILRSHWRQPTLAAQLRRYEQQLKEELSMVDQLVSGCYRARQNFRLFAAFSMLYFAAATTYERRRHRRELSPGAAFLCADDSAYRHVVNELRKRLASLGPVEQASMHDVDSVEHAVREGLRPFNSAGLCDPEARNMYRYTAAPKQ